MLNVGAGPLNHPLSKLFVRRALACADYISFRDEKSRMLASQIGFKGTGQVYPDCVYSREIRRSIRGCESSRHLVVGIAPMPYCDPRVDPSEKNQVIYENFIERLATFAASLAKDPYQVVLFGTDIGVDPLAITDLQRRLLAYGKHETLEYKPVESIDALLSNMSALDYVVTCRFHGVIFAHLLNKPVLALSHHPKVMTLMNDLGLSSYCVDIRTFDPLVLAERFASLVHNSDEIKERMAGTLAKYRSQSMRQFEELFAR
jgi:polysaccharide pyruvyl transferase WcaK-like protein